MTNNKIPVCAPSFKKKGKKQEEAEKESEEEKCAFCSKSILIGDWKLQGSNGKVYCRRKCRAEEEKKVEEDCPFEQAAEEWNTTEIKVEDQPKSIWKDVSELDKNNNTDLLLKRKTGKVILTQYLVGILDDRFDNTEEKFCTLTDFINFVEDLDKRIKKLEEEL